MFQLYAKATTSSEEGKHFIPSVKMTVAQPVNLFWPRMFLHTQNRAPYQGALPGFKLYTVRLSTSQTPTRICKYPFHSLSSPFLICLLLTPSPTWSHVMSGDFCHVTSVVLITWVLVTVWLNLGNKSTWLGYGTRKITAWVKMSWAMLCYVGDAS